MKKGILILGPALFVLLVVSAGLCAYHHEGEHDSDNFLAVYPDKAGTKLDSCALCHSGGQYVNSKGKLTSLGSCQWCHETYKFDGSGSILDTLNAYGMAYHDNGRNAAAISAIETVDSDGDGYSNKDEIVANRFPGNASDDPSKQVAPSRIYTKFQLEAMTKHTQFLLMNTTRSGDYYAEYGGVPMWDLIQDAGIDTSATGILVYSPDGFSQYHPLTEDPDPGLYHVNGSYPEAAYYYDEEADQAKNQADGWCDYSAPSCKGRSNGDAIVNPDGLKMILAYEREGAAMDPGILDASDKLDGEGPFRVVPPQKDPKPPDQLSTASNQNVKWPFDPNGDHNAGASSRTVTIIKVEPLPAGTTDIDLLEAGWAYVDQEKIIVYGDINGTDSNGNGILDSEEGADPNSDFDGDGTPDFQDPDTATVRHAKGTQKVVLHTSNGAFADVQCLCEDDPGVCQKNKPSMTFPYGTTKFKVTGLAPGEAVTVTLVFPDNVPTSSKYYKISPTSGWQEVPFGSNDGDNKIALTLTDGDPKTDSDGLLNGSIDDPGALATTSSGTSTVSAAGGGGGCFIAATGCGSKMEALLNVFHRWQDRLRKALTHRDE